MGGLSNVREGDLFGLAAAFVVGTVGIMALRWRINVMASATTRRARSAWT